jgi:hypothetical protein
MSLFNVRFSKFKGKEYAYLYRTEFLVQVAKDNSACIYSTMNKFIGNMEEAIKFYSEMKVEPKHKKRMVMVGDIGETVVDMERY